MKRIHLLAAIGAGVVLAGCAAASRDDLEPTFQSMLKGSFRSQGIATVDRLDQDAGERACSTGHPLSPDVARQLQADAQAGIRPPSDGQYLGDWRQGEKLAQNGRGMTWTDKSAAPSANGANCYNCHQITKAEISFGTIGPSLYHYGKNRGVKDVAAPESAAVVQYTWSKIWNSKAHVACSNMPRFGHMHLLNETQIRDLMSLLLDPRSPVNQ